MISLVLNRLEREHEARAIPASRLMHLRDMPDPGFCYRPDLAMSGRSRASTVSHGSGIGCSGMLAQPVGSVARANHRRDREINGLGESQRVRIRTREAKEIFDSLWANPNPTHAVLRHGSATAPTAIGGGPASWRSVSLVRFSNDRQGGRRAERAQADRIRTEFPDWAPSRNLPAYVSRSIVLSGV